MATTKPPDREIREPRLSTGQFSLRVLFMLVFSIALMAAGVRWLSGQLGDASYAVERSECQSNLTNIWLALEAYMQQHGDIPRGPHDQSAIAPLTSLKEDALKCPTARRQSRQEGRYRLAPDISMATFQPGTVPILIVFDVSPVHGHDRSMANVLYSDGSVRVLAGTDAEYEQRIILLTQQAPAPQP